MIVADALGAPPVSPGHAPSHAKEGSRLRTPATLCLLFPPLEHVQQHSLTKQSVHYAPGATSGEGHSSERDREGPVLVELTVGGEA